VNLVRGMLVHPTENADAGELTFAERGYAMWNDRNYDPCEEGRPSAHLSVPSPRLLRTKEEGDRAGINTPDHNGPLSLWGWGRCRRAEGMTGETAEGSEQRRGHAGFMK
jgi:hypothetical protein